MFRKAKAAEGAQILPWHQTFAVGIIMPILILILESCMLKEGVYSLSNFTLHYWIGDPDPKIMEGMPGIFKNPDFKKALFNSARLTLVNGVFGTIFGQMLGYIFAKGRGQLPGKLVEFMHLHVVQDCRNEKHRVCTDRPRLIELVWINHEILAQDRKIGHLPDLF